MIRKLVCVLLLLSPFAVSAYAAKPKVVSSGIRFVSQNGTPIVGASVTIVITEPNGATITQSGTTDSTGTITFKYRIKKNDPTGTWTVNATATVQGQTLQGSTSFLVQ